MLLGELCDGPPLFHGFVVPSAPNRIPLFVELLIVIVVPQCIAEINGAILSYLLYALVEGACNDFEVQWFVAVVARARAYGAASPQPAGRAVIEDAARGPTLCLPLRGDRVCVERDVPVALGTKRDQQGRCEDSLTTEVWTVEE